MKKYDDFSKHLSILKKAHLEDLENEFIISGIIDKFYIQFELGWKVLKELMQYEGKSVAMTGSPREIIKASYVCYDFMNEEIWLKMLKDRNNTAHIYDENAAKGLVTMIIEEYIPEFVKMDTQIFKLYGDVLKEI